MPTIAKIASRSVQGLPYLQKELARRLSIATGKVFSTPTSFYVIFSGRCNLACPFCEIYKAVDPILPDEVMLRIVRQAKDLSGTGFNISLSGGEPMIYKPLYDALKLSHELGVDFGFTTNGLGLIKTNVERIIGYNPFNVNISLESVDPKINESLRPFAGGTSRTLKGLELLLEQKQRARARTSVIIKPTIMEQNYRTLPALVRHFGKDSGVQVNFQPYVGEKGAPFWVQDLENLRRIIEELKELQRSGFPIIGNEQTLEGFFAYLCKPPINGIMKALDLEGGKRNCDIGLRSMFIYPDGSVHFCDFLKQAIGNVHQQSLSEIYYGAIADSQRQGMVYCNIDCQQTCKRPTPLLTKAKAYLRMG